jgi:asparagine synthetase B (glutamine-hydrolysing)
MDLARRTVRVSPFAAPPALGADSRLDEVAEGLRRDLATWFGRLAARFGDMRVRVCLSGGVDSSVVAAWAARTFRDVVAYTFTHRDAGGRVSEDAEAGQNVARHLGLEHRLLAATDDDLVGALGDALRYGQDWRDFNVHCAIVNTLLARAIAADAHGAGTVVLTGDLANELMADYSPVHYRGVEYYPLPDVPLDRLRASLVKGLQSGDREVGVFDACGLLLIQPYGLCHRRLARLSADVLRRPNAKGDLMRAVAGDVLPAQVFERRKVRAQIGDAEVVAGVLPVLAARGLSQDRLRDLFCEALRVPGPAALRDFVRTGVYRWPRVLPDKPVNGDGYLTI